MTYSIVARDPQSGHMGVATQSQAFAVGSSVPWALPGSGVIATQSMGEPMYGELGLDVLRSGLTASEALTALQSVDPYPERRQVAMADSDGGIDVYTGSACVQAAGHRIGDGCAALANMMRRDTVWDVMVEAFESSTAAFPDRLLAALRAAEDEGGDLRGQRSAAVVVVCAERSGRPWRDHVVDLRVDDHDRPLDELERMLTYNRRYHQMVAAFEEALDGAPDRAVTLAEEVGVMTAREPELALWEAVALVRADRPDEARAVIAELRTLEEGWIETLRRFGDVGLIDAADVATLLR